MKSAGKSFPSAENLFQPVHWGPCGAVRALAGDDGAAPGSKPAALADRGKADKHLKMVLIGIYFVHMYHV